MCMLWGNVHLFPDWAVFCCASQFIWFVGIFHLCFMPPSLLKLHITVASGAVLYFYCHHGYGWGLLPALWNHYSWKPFSFFSFPILFDRTDRTWEGEIGKDKPPELLPLLKCTPCKWGVGNETQVFEYGNVCDQPGALLLGLCSSSWCHVVPVSNYQWL